MDTGTLVLFGLVTLLGLNQLVVRVDALLKQPAIFGLLWLTLLGAGSAVLWWGLPGFEAWPAVSWVVGLMFFLHAAQDLSVRQARLRALQAADEAVDREAREAALRAALAEE